MLFHAKKQFFRPRKSVAKCPLCRSIMRIMRKSATEYIDSTTGEHLCYQYVECLKCGAKGKTESHTKISMSGVAIGC